MGWPLILGGLAAWHFLSSWQQANREGQLIGAQTDVMKRQAGAESQAMATMMEYARAQRAEQRSTALMQRGTVNQDMMSAMLMQRLMGGGPQPMAADNIMARFQPGQIRM